LNGFTRVAFPAADRRNLKEECLSNPRWASPALVLALALAFRAAVAEPERAPPPAPLRAWQTGALRPDRLQHASLSFSLGLALGIPTREPAAAAGGALALALAKETADRRRGAFDRGDLLAGAAGALLAALATAALRR